MLQLLLQSIMCDMTCEGPVWPLRVIVNVLSRAADDSSSINLIIIFLINRLVPRRLRGDVLMSLID